MWKAQQKFLGAVDGNGVLITLGVDLGAPCLTQGRGDANTVCVFQICIAGCQLGGVIQLCTITVLNFGANVRGKLLGSDKLFHEKATQKAQLRN